MHAVKGVGKDHAKFSPVGMLRPAGLPVASIRQDKALV